MKRGYLQVGQLRHEGDWQPAPKAMRNLMLEARKVGLDVVLKTIPVYPSDEAVLDYRFLYMHGRNAFTAKKEDLKHLRFNLKSGGLLLADACCGNKQFDASFRAFIKELFADDKQMKLEADPHAGRTVQRRPQRRGDPDGAAADDGRQARDPDVQDAAAGAGGRQVQGAMGGDLQQVRYRLRPGEALVAGLPGP